MGAYVYAARSPKFARQIVVEWTQEYEYVERKTTQGYTNLIAEPRPVRPREIITVAVWAYLYKPWSDMRRDRYGMALLRRLDRLEDAWKDYSLPHAVVVSDEKRRYKIVPGDEVIGWNRRANTSGYDDPDWGRACRYGKVVRVVGPADLDPPPHDHKCKRCNRGLKWDCTKRTCTLDPYNRTAYDESGCYICERQQLDRDQNR